MKTRVKIETGYGDMSLEIPMAMTFEDYQEHDCTAGPEDGCSVCLRAVEEGLIQDGSPSGAELADLAEDE